MSCHGTSAPCPSASRFADQLVVHIACHSDNGATTARWHPKHRLIHDVVSLTFLGIAGDVSGNFVLVGACNG